MNNSLKKKILICVYESDKSAQIDNVYVNSLIKTRYKEEIKDWIILDINAGGKAKIPSNKIKKIIDNKLMCGAISNKNYDRNINVVLFVDTDENDEALNNKINEFAAINSYKVVRFKRDIEEVFLGKQINKKAKINVAKKFIKISKTIDYSDNKFRINANLLINKQSNINLVLDEIIKLK